MKTLLKATLIFLFLCVLAGSVFADGNALTCASSTAVLNRYVFRGYEISSNSIVIQPSLTFSYDGFAATLWENLDSSEHATQYFIPDKPGEARFNETDFILAYTRSIGRFSLAGGYAYYAMEYSIPGDTEELFISATCNVLAKPTLSIYRDIAEFPGTYLNLSLSHSKPVCKSRGITLDAAASAGYCAGDAHHEAGHDTRQKQLADGHVGGHTKDHERDRRRNDRCNDAGRGNQAARARLLVASAHHHGQQQGG